MASDPRIAPPLPPDRDGELLRTLRNYEMAGSIGPSIPDVIRVGNATLTGEELSTLKDMSKFLQYLMEVDPAMKDRFVAFRTMQKIMR